MPSMANITVLDRAGANVVYTAATPSAGDRSPAVWRANALSAILGNRPVFSILSRDNTRKNGRHFTAHFRFPVTYVDATSGLEKVIGIVPISLEMTVPTNLEEHPIEDAFTQLGNLLVSSLIRSAVTSGYSPT
jgi:hypothetical protein